MITVDKVRIFNKYNGKIERLIRVGSKAEKMAIKDEDWLTIDNLIQDLFLSGQKLTSLEFNGALDNKLKRNCDNEETVIQLKKMVNDKMIKGQ